MGFGANTANLMNLCGITMEQGMGVISTPEERKEATEPISLSVSFPPDTPKTPLTSGRQFLHHGATPSPSLLNPISDEDWKESTSRLSILCPKLPSPKTSEILLRRLKAGYRLVRFQMNWYDVPVQILHFSYYLFPLFTLIIAKALHLENTSHNIVLLLTENCQSLRIAGASIGQVDSNYGHEKLGDYFIIVALSNILRLDIGITPVEVMKRPISERNHPLTCFSIVTKVPVGKLQQLEFSTSSTADRESILSALAIVLNPEKQHRPNLLLHPRAPGFGRHLAQRAPYRTDNCLMERIPTIQRLPDVVALELETIETTIDEDVSTRTRIFESTPPRQIRASATSRTQRDQGTELALIDRSDSDDPLWGLEESTSQDDTGVLAVQTKGISKSMDAMEWRGTPEGEIIASGTTTAMWCTDNVCSNALKDIFQTFQGIMFTSSPMNSAESADKRQEVENYIAYILGAPTATSQSPSDERSKATQSPDGRTDLPVLNSNIRNRATQINASANRWRQLKSEMTFSSALERSNQHMQVLQTTKSMDDIEGLLYMQSTQPAEPSFFDATGYLSSLVDQLLPEKEQPDESSILYYDSDPEDARSHKFGRGYTRAKVKTSQPNMGSPAVLRNQLCFRTRTVGRRIEEEEVLNVVDVSSYSMSLRS